MGEDEKNQIFVNKSKAVAVVGMFDRTGPKSPDEIWWTKLK